MDYCMRLYAVYASSWIKFKSMTCLTGLTDTK